MTKGLAAFSENLCGTHVVVMGKQICLMEDRIMIRWSYDGTSR